MNRIPYVPNLNVLVHVRDNLKEEYNINLSEEKPFVKQ